MDSLEDKLILVQQKIDRITTDLPLAWIGASEGLTSVTASLPRFSEMQCTFLALKGMLQNYVSLYDELTVAQTDFKEEYKDASVISFLSHQKERAQMLRDNYKKECAKEGKLKDRRVVQNPDIYLQQADSVVTTTQKAAEMLTHDFSPDNLNAFKENFFDDNGNIGFVTQLNNLYKSLLSQLNSLTGNSALGSLKNVLAPDLVDYVEKGIEYVKIRDYDVRQICIYGNECLYNIRVSAYHNLLRINCIDDEAVIPTRPYNGVIDLLGKSNKDNFTGRYDLVVPISMKKLTIVGNNNNLSVSFNMGRGDIGRYDPFITMSGKNCEMRCQDGYQELVSMSQRSLENTLSLFK